MDKRITSILLTGAMSCLIPDTGFAQNTEREDSTDIFYKHLELGEVVITGLAGDTKVKRMPSPVVVLRPSDIRSKASTSITGVLSQQPGISEITTGGSISKPVIRGLGYNRVVVVSDGIRQEGQQWGDDHGIEIDAAGVYSAEILKGPASLMYGSDALSGVIIFHSEPAAPEGSITGSLEAEYQSCSSLFGYSASNSGNIDGAVWNVRLSDKYSQAYRNPADGRVPGSGFTERAASAVVGKNGCRGFAKLKFSYYHQRLGMIEGERDDATGQLVGSLGCKPPLPFQQIHHYKVISDNTLHLPLGECKAIVGWQQNRRQEFEESAMLPGLDMRLNTLNYDIRLTSDPHAGWKLSAGIGGMYQRSDNLGDEFLIPDYWLLDAGAFVNASGSAGKWTFSGGLRSDARRLNSKACKGVFDAFARHFSGISASIGAVGPIGEHITVRANIARGFRAPNVSELGANGHHEGTFRFERGNHSLKPENSLQADLGVDIASKYIHVQSSLFLSHISNYIYLAGTGSMSSEGEPVFSYLSGTANLKGAEISLDIHPAHRVHVASAFSCVFAKEHSGSYLPMTPAPRLFSELKYELFHDGKFFNNTFFAVNMDACMRQDRIFTEGGTETPTPAYTLIGASAGTDLLIKGKTAASFYVIISNLTDKVYQSHLSRLKYAGINNATGRRGIFNPGRNISLRMILSF